VQIRGLLDIDTRDPAYESRPDSRHGVIDVFSSTQASLAFFQRGSMDFGKFLGLPIVDHDPWPVFILSYRNHRHAETRKAKSYRPKQIHGHLLVHELSFPRNGPLRSIAELTSHPTCIKEDPSRHGARIAGIDNP
jgi:hypothetical protein